MYIPVNRPVPVFTSPRRKRTRDERVAMVSELVDQQLAGDPVSPRQVRAVAHRHGVHPVTIRRAMQESLTVPPEPRGWRAPRELFVRVGMHDGNIWKAFKEMEAEEARGEHDWGLKGYWTAYRAIHRDPGLQLALAKGPEALDEFLLVGVFEPTFVNELSYLDAMHVPVRCQDKYGRVIDDLWLLGVLEAFSRGVTSHAVCVGEVTGQLTADTYLATTLGRLLSVEELAKHGIERSDPAFFGGVSDVLMVDNALANKADVVKDAVRLAESRLIFARPHIATDKAKQERWHDTIQGALAALPGFKDGAETHPADGHGSRHYAIPTNGRLPRVEAVIETLDHAIEDYNWNHVVSTTASTPIGRFLAA